MLIAPFSHDQLDNGARVDQLGCARVLKLKRYRARRIARELGTLIGRA